MCVYACMGEETYRQNTNLTTRGIVFDGLRVSPAVIPKLSVPPSAQPHSLSTASSPITGRTRTSKGGSDEHACKPAEPADKRRAGDVPVLASDVCVLVVRAQVDGNAHDNEDNDGDNLDGGEPVLCSS